MANINFIPWIEDSVVSNNTQNVVYGYNDFNKNDQRQNGFKPNTLASSKLVNTALRQANLFVSSLAKALLSDVTYDSSGEAVIGDINLKTSEDYLTKVIKNAFPFEFSTVLKHSILKSSTVGHSSLIDDDATKIKTALTGYKFDISISSYFRRIFGNDIPVTYGGPSNAPLAKYDSSKGSIESRLKDVNLRLEKLGFKSGVITFAGIDYGSDNATDTSGNGIFRQGNYVFCRIVIQDKSIQINKDFFTKVPEGFYPKQKTYFTVTGSTGTTTSSWNCGILYSIGTDGIIKREISYESQGAPTQFKNWWISFGYEAEPIT